MRREIENMIAASDSQVLRQLFSKFDCSILANCSGIRGLQKLKFKFSACECFSMSYAPKSAALQHQFIRSQLI